MTIKAIRAQCHSPSLGPSLVIGLIASFSSGICAAQAPISWVPSWGAAQHRLEGDARLSEIQLKDATLRQSVRLSIGGKRLKIVLSNIAGDRPMTVAGVHVALSGMPGSAMIKLTSDRPVMFDGKPGIVIPAGGTATSDGVSLTVPSLAHLSISMHLEVPSGEQTGHLRALSTSWLVKGNRLAATTFVHATPVDHWYQLAAVQVEASDPHLVVTLGDSITDGSRSTPNTDGRWPDVLAERLSAAPLMHRWAVVNAGIAGNQLLADGYGESAVARFDRDVLSQPHVRTVILFEGINDVGQLGMKNPSPADRRALAARIVEAYEQLTLRAHARGIRVIGATLTPFIGSDYAPTRLDEEARQTINSWIRSPGHFDAVLDFDAILRDPIDPTRLEPEFDSGDHLHPSREGYRRIGNSIPISQLAG